MKRYFILCLVILISFTVGAIFGARIVNKEFMSWNVKSDREYIAFEVKRIAKERPVLDMRIEQLIREFEKFEYQVDRITILKKGQKVNIVLEEEEK